MELWENKLKENFGTAAVDKEVALKNQISELPRYVSEYLLGCFSTDGINEINIKEMHDYLRDHRVPSKEKEKGKHQLQTTLRKQLIDKYKASINLTKNTNNLEIPSLGENNAFVLNSILQEHPRILIDGLWGLAELQYDPEAGSISMTKFKPFQLSNINVKEYIEVRKGFTTDEWINVLISTVGLNYKNYTQREKIIILSRLIPMVEKNIFLMEFGYPGTGKTYAFEQISSYSRVISGSKVSAPQLFYNLTTKQEGLLCQYDVVLFDEIDKIKKGGIDEEVISKLYQYLASGKFDRGGIEKNSACGIMMVGNLPKGNVPIEELLQVLLNEEMLRDAFLDRLNGVIPGWELDSIQNRELSLTKNWGFAADYFSEIMNGLREYNFNDIFYSKIKLVNASTRDEDGIKNTFSGLMKLIYPDGIVCDEEIRILIDYSVEIRQFILKQIYSIYKNPKFDRRIIAELN
ncbi:MAG TPA: BREX system Lon protease-like protein BrxL [Candidatus Paceibacterota bacterium]